MSASAKAQQILAMLPHESAGTRPLQDERIYLDSICTLLLIWFAKLRQTYIIKFKNKQDSNLLMNRLHRNNTDILPERYPNYNTQYNKSPIRRQNTNLVNATRSPIRSRTPTRHVSPIKNNSQQIPIKFISNVSPSKERPANQENYLEFSNGKSIKYINSNLNDKNYQNRKIELSKKTERNAQEDNRLFGKLVNKLNSEKKSGLKSNENSYRTSVFGDNSDNKTPRMEQTTGKPETGVFKQLFNQVRAAETNYQTKSASKHKDNSVEKGEGLSCLVYKIKANLTRQKDEPRQKKNSKQKMKDTGFANTPSILLKRKHSKLEQDQRIGSSPALKKQPSQRREEEEEDYADFDNLLARVDQKRRDGPRRPLEEVVKMSVRVEQSLNMDPFM